MEVLTSQSQTPKPEWMEFLATAKARTRLRAALRKELQPMTEQGREMLTKFLKDAEVEGTNEVITRIMSFYHVPTREALYQKIGSGEVDLNGYVLRESPKTNPGLLKKIFRLGTRGTASTKTKAKEKERSVVTPDKINTKEVYKLYQDDKEQNFVFVDCCHPMPGDDVMGFVNDNNQVEVHALTCPRAQVLKASYGPRIVATEWQTVHTKFLATVSITGVDRHGILQELTQMISNHLNIDIRSLHIDTDKEVFSCRLSVLVQDAEVMNALCARVKKIKGVQSAIRV